MSTLTLTIDRLAGLGDGVSTHEGTQIFVSKAAQGDTLRVRITEAKAGIKRAEIIDIIKGGPARTDAPCPHYATCGGCTLQHLTPASYQEFKTSIITTALGYAGFPGLVPQMHFLPPTTRRRADFKVENGTLAYLAGKSHTRVPISTCLILLPELEALIAPINALLPKFPAITGMNITRADSGIDLLLQLSGDDKAGRYTPFFDNLPLARVSVQRSNRAIELVGQRGPVSMHIGGHDIAIPADAFLQASSEAQALLTEMVIAATKGASPVADLFCGIGTYSFPMSERARVHAVDNNGPMIDHIRGISPKVSVEKRDLFLQPLHAKELAKYKACVINPPRMGAAAQVAQLAQSGIGRIVMVSCNPATWGRDAKTLKLAGYTLESLAAIDQFVYSPHMELVSIFTKKA